MALDYLGVLRELVEYYDLPVGRLETNTNLERKSSSKQRNTDFLLA
jgi:hypothetical protein